MKGKKHSAEQIIKKLREADAILATGKTIGQVVQTLEISEQTLHRWRNQYGGMKSEEAKRLKELEIENKRPKLFQNLRSTRETELMETYPAHVVCAWIGNSEAVARKH